MATLGIFAPYLGALSETFIRRHMADLLPEKTVVIAGSEQPPYGGHWNVEAPKYVVPELKSLIELNRKQKLLNLVRQAVGLKSKSNLIYDTGLKKFLQQNEVTTILGEYLDISTTIIELANALNIKLYAHAHGYDISIKLKQTYWRKEYLKLNKIAGVITMSNYSKKLLVDLGIKEELIHIIPCGVKIPPPFVKHKEGSFVKCLAVGRMVAKKAPLLLLESFRKAAEKDSTLTLDYIGSGNLYHDVEKYIKDHQLGNKVLLHKSLSNEEVHALMRKADIFLQHSITNPVNGDQEGLPVSILEAMSHGLPVVSTQHAGIPEAVINRVSGFTVKEGDTESMANKILLLAEKEALRNVMGNAGKDLVAERFSWEIEKKALQNLFFKKNSFVVKPQNNIDQIYHGKYS